MGIFNEQSFNHPFVRGIQGAPGVGFNLTRDGNYDMVGKKLTNVFRDCSYLLYDINRQTAPVSILHQFVKSSQIHNYRTTELMFAKGANMW